MKKIIVLLAVVLMLTGCGEKEYFKQIYLEDLKAYTEDGESGFILVVNENNQDFQEYVKNVAESEEVEINMYNVYQSAEGAQDNRPVVPFDGFDTFNELYYLENNEEKGSLEITAYEDMRLTEETKHFVDLHK